jgi:AcrR family transcriptional regulator
MGWTYSDIEHQLEAFADAPEDSDAKKRRRGRILQAATELFIEQGYRKTSVDEVAIKAGVAKGTVYLYFKTKADLMVQAIVEEKKQYLVRIKPVLDAPPRQRLEKYIRLAFVMIREMPLMSKLLSGDREVLQVMEEMDADIRQQTLELQTGFVAEMLDAATEPHRWTREELVDRAKVLLALIYSSGVITDERVRRGLSVERFAGILADLIVHGVTGGLQQTETS